METLIYSAVPVLPIRNTLIFPGTAVPLTVGRPRSRKALAAARAAEGDLEGRVLIVAQREDTRGEPKSEQLYRVGTICQLEKVRGNDEDGYQILARGIARFRVHDYNESGDATFASGEVWKDDLDVDKQTGEVLLDGLKGMSREILGLVPGDTTQLSELVEGITDLVFLTHLCSANIEMPLVKRQQLLETVSVKSRVLSLMDLMQGLKETLLVRSEIRSKLDQKMGKAQREHILREQLRAIKEELGEPGAGASEEGDLRRKIDEAGMPDDVKKHAEAELKRLDTIGEQSPEAHVIRNYLELLAAMPWNKSAPEADIDLEHAREVLDRDHYGLTKIKKRILQHLAVMKLTAGKAEIKGKAPILLFVGPPGVGKTSLGQSIARALGRKFVRASLGGVRDDAEIRGHRRTYIGAMPGRIIQSLKRAGENNPVLMLDEIDKLASSFHGDPAAALLEVLDPEQNQAFLDHYLDVPFDLSKVFFIATANTLETIPGPLLDRMEVIELTGYTTAEKLHIARNYLVPKEQKSHGLREQDVVISDEALLKLINSYTREAGVRDLQRKIGAVFRDTTEKVVGKNAMLPVAVRPESLDEILGGERYVHEVAERIAPPGVVTGLAWTPVGGEILFIESQLMPGSGKLLLTGQLGDVMKESAQIAQSLVRSKLAHVVPALEHEKHDVHVHVPSGAIPKDGPSAGIALLTALASLFSGRTVDPKTAMTGEITLRGAVMPVGGIKEKVLAAHRAGITRIILSRRNEKDLREVPAEIKSQLKFELVDKVEDVLRLALGIEVGESKTQGAAPPTAPAAVA